MAQLKQRGGSGSGDRPRPSPGRVASVLSANCRTVVENKVSSSLQTTQFHGPPGRPITPASSRIGVAGSAATRCSATRRAASSGRVPVPDPFRVDESSRRICALRRDSLPDNILETGLRDRSRMAEGEDRGVLASSAQRTLTSRGAGGPVLDRAGVPPTMLANPRQPTRRPSSAGLREDRQIDSGAVERRRWRCFGASQDPSAALAPPGHHPRSFCLPRQAAIRRPRCIRRGGGFHATRERPFARGIGIVVSRSLIRDGSRVDSAPCGPRAEGTAAI
jgi:hypothetical protein